jgi:predicted nuclease with TOPRIM domain
MSAQSSGGQAGLGTGGLDGLSTELETIEVLCSAVPEIDEDLRELSATVEALNENLDELEGDTEVLEAKVGDLGEALGQLAENVTDLEETVEGVGARQDEIEARLDAVEGCLNPDLLEKQEAHIEAQRSSFPFDRGDERELTVEEVNGRPDATLRGKIEKVQTFVDVDDPTEYEMGDVVDVTITDLNGNAAHAMPTAATGE